MAAGWGRTGASCGAAGEQLIAVRVALEPTFMVGRARVLATGAFCAFVAADTELRRDAERAAVCVRVRGRVPVTDRGAERGAQLV